MKFLWVLSVLFWSVYSFAAQSGERAIYLQLSSGFYQEVAGFDQTSESATVLNEFKNDWQKFISGKSELPQRWFSGYTWSPYLTGLRGQSSFRPVPVDIQKITTLPQVPALIGEHSIPDANKYATERLGEKIVDVLKKENMKSIIYAGSADSVPATYGIPAESMKQIPSPYSSWGILKFMVSGKAYADQEPRFLLVVPPSKEYLIHYQNIFSQLNLKLESAKLNDYDQVRERKALTNAFKTIAGVRGGSIDVVALGYYDNLKSKLQAVLPETELKVGSGMTLFIGDDLATKPATRYLLIKSDLTIWGESSARLIQSALSLDPKAVLFMGSAGGLTPKTSLYDIAVPSEFYLRGVKLPVKNEILANIQGVNAINLEGIQLGTRHGHTNSPMEQTKKFVSSYVTSGIESLDVEQNLIAEAVARHNLTAKRKVVFAAANLITDKPHSFQYSHADGFDLTRVDWSKKSLARARAVETVMTGFRNSSALNKIKITCQSYFKEAL